MSYRTVFDCARFVVVGGLLALGLVSCKGLFEVENKGELSPDDLDDPRAVENLARGAQETFVDAYDTFISDVAVPTDEFIFTGARIEWKQLDEGRIVDTNDRVTFNWVNGQRARFMADEAVRRIRGLLDAPDESPLVAQSLFYAGFSRILLAEYYEVVTFDNGPAIAPADVMLEALGLLEEAAGVAENAGDDELLVAAIAGQARAHFSRYVMTDELSSLQAAADDANRALGIDPAFEFLAEYEPPASWNRVQDWNHRRQAIGVAPRYRFITDPVSGEVDPRVDVEFVSIAFSSPNDSLYFQLKYPTPDSPIPIVKWEAMKLIIAESQLEDGDLDGAVSTLNELRQRPEVGLSEFNSSDPDEIFEQLIYERSVELWLEGRRWQDARRSGQMPPQAPEDQWAAPSNTIDPIEDVFPLPAAEKEGNPNV